MAERISTFVPHPPGRRPLYPWDEWTDGSAWRIRRGEDFAVPTTSMAAIIRAQASLRGMRVQTRRDGEDVVEFQFRPAVAEVAA